MSEWKEYKLGELIQSVSDTYRFKPNEKVVFLNTSDILDGKFLTDSLSDVHTLPGQAKKRIQKGDILFSEIRPANKRFALVNFECDNYVVSTKLMVLRCNENVDNRFIYTYLTSIEVLEYLQMVAEDRSGTFPQITFDIIAKMDIELPPHDEQRRIASILSSLDDKIDLLHRENATLKQMAETLFKQWFVEEAKEEWEEKPLSFYGKIVCGKTPPKKESKYFGGETPFIKIPDMHNKTFVINSEDSLTKEGVLYQKEKTLPPFSVIVSCIATVGLVVLNAKESQTNQQINSIIPNKEEYRYFLYLQLKNMYDDLNAMASGGTATLNLNTSSFSNIKIPCPTDDILGAFHNQVAVLFDKIYCNQKQIQTLIQTRDRLLPRLMGGEIKI